MVEVNDFNAIRISLASPEQIKSWSYGEVTEPETINYRTLKPEKDGLFCERIFGPTKNFECYCGKYKKIRYRGITCDRCGVTVEHSRVRRTRMGHIELAAPVAHIWFAKGVPSRLALLLDVSPRKLERVLYFAEYIIISVNQAICKERMDQLKKEKAQPLNENTDREAGEINELVDQETGEINEAPPQKEKDIISRKEEIEGRISEIENLQPLKTLNEARYQELRKRCGDCFEAGMGAEAILSILKNINLEELRQDLTNTVKTSPGQKRKKANKRLRVVEAFWRSSNKPEWMILTILPVLPPDLRPIVQLDGGRFATSDLNDLYRRVINRNNRLKRLLDLKAPEIIINNEKRMLQESVDALIDNGRRGRQPAAASTHKLKSLSDMLRGKQGRFRQNLLGKRVDYSGRSVIVAGPELKLHQCGLPKHMALELFKPFVMRKLVEQGFAHNIKSARRQVEKARPEVWDILREVVKERPVMLNRAPTLHRLSIQAFEPVLIEGNAIQIHPLVCTAFNADFDGDQMAVHLPLSKAAVRECRERMLSTNNMLLPSSGEPVMTPTLDMVLGCYYLTNIRPGGIGEGTKFANFEEAKIAYELGMVALNAEILARKETGNEGKLKTTVGRIIFNDVVPEEFQFINKTMDKTSLKRLVSDCYHKLGSEPTVKMLDNLMKLGFEYATKSGTTIAAKDVEVPASKPKIIEEGDEKVAVIESQFNRGLITDEERYNSTIQVWTDTTDKIRQEISHSLDRYGGIYMMANSGAKGNLGQITQMAGMRGLMTDPSGRIIDLPIKSSFREGLTVMEYFISTHGARKGLADTALRTSDAGYLTRRLIDVSQDLIIFEDDCGTEEGIWLHDQSSQKLLALFQDRILGRMAAIDIVDPGTGEIIAARNTEIIESIAEQIVASKIKQVYVRSPLCCHARRGICQNCYGRDLSQGKPVTRGTAVGIIAAESIGEPGTQLTLRTFHTGGVVGADITSGLPRVEELFEARIPKGVSILTEIDGTAEVMDREETRKIVVTNSESYIDEYVLPLKAKMTCKDGDWIDAGMPLIKTTKEAEEKKVTKKARKNQSIKTETREITEREQQSIALSENLPIARVSGYAVVDHGQLSIRYEEKDEREYIIPSGSHIRIKSGDKVKAGDQLTDGAIDPQDILRIMGREAVQQYLIEEVQKVYRSQGVNINDKHIEIIVRQMLRRVRVESPGDTERLAGDLIDRFEYDGIIAKILAEGGEPATAQTVLLGITRASLNTASWLAAASFQETTRVLTEAAIWGKTDKLLGLKENVIIGKLIPAQSIIFDEEIGLPSLQIEEGTQIEPTEPIVTEPKSDIPVEEIASNASLENVPIATVSGSEVIDDSQPSSRKEAAGNKVTKKAKRNKSISLESVNSETGEIKEPEQQSL